MLKHYRGGKFPHPIAPDVNIKTCGTIDKSRRDETIVDIALDETGTHIVRVHNVRWTEGAGRLPWKAGGIIVSPFMIKALVKIERRDHFKVARR
jgi:hypothetical protein